MWASQLVVRCITAPRLLARHSLDMKTKLERPYKVVRTLPDGERLLVGTFEDANEARKRVAAFTEYWPGDYVIVPPTYEQRVNQ